MAPHSSIYKPLDPKRSHIRLVTIHPKNQVSQQIKCDLETYPLDKQLDYEALSYVWGEQGSEIEILLNGQVFPVRWNLAFALMDLRLADRPRRLWIDAICINQGDHEERSSQVLLMRQIYRYASRVVVWLGICTFCECLSLESSEVCQRNDQSRSGRNARSVGFGEGTDFLGYRYVSQRRSFVPVL